ncbi:MULTISPECIES: hypothetical protein [unclassified Bradyrhizobium]|uniref:hypothetical protein n=1 Tax=unclassified Bradyrhizobium TaxID=2631580 RepID=UPI0029160AF2|nr:MULTISPECIES: hypothetical protein [unclassified Bradyrhizobium]
MKDLPPHGRINCSRCFPGSAKWGNTSIEQDGWILENNPLAWGATNPRYLVLGFSKGAQQCEKLLVAAHDEIPFAGFRHNLTAILRKLGLLALEQSIDDRISESEIDYAFGSLIRCSVSHIDPTTGVASKSGDIINRLSRRSPSNDWALNCMRQFLTDLPSRLEVVVLLSNDSNCIDACFRRLQSLHPSMKRINSVAYSDGRVTWIHTVHGSPLAQSHINAWLDGGNTAQGLKQREAVQAAKHVLGRQSLSTSSSETVDTAGLPEEQRAKAVDPAQPRAAAPISSLGPLQSAGCPRFERLSRDGELFVAHRYEDGLYRMANPALGAKKHHAANQIAVDIGAVAGYLKRGYLLRMRGETSKQVNLISPSEIRIIGG